MSRIVATFLYVGYLGPGPGTWGSLAAILAAMLITLAAGPWLLLAAIFAAVAAGWWATLALTADAPGSDPAEIVIDEVAGQWIALLPVVFGAAWAGMPPTALWPGWIAAFVLFRLFDITKWGPVGWADRRHGATGVMLDDIIAGLLAALGVVLLAAAAHGLMRL